MGGQRIPAAATLSPQIADNLFQLRFISKRTGRKDSDEIPFPHTRKILVKAYKELQRAQLNDGGHSIPLDIADRKACARGM